MSDRRKFVVGVDLGTSGPKVALFDLDGGLRAWAFAPTPLLLLPEGGAEQRPDDWWQAICRCTRKVVAEANIEPADVVALGCSAQWSGTVAVDEEGVPLRNAIIWMDSRGASYLNRIGGGAWMLEGFALSKILYWLKVSGGIPGASGKDPIAHMLYIKHEEPEVYQATYKFLEPLDYLNLRMTGKAASSYHTIALAWMTDNRDIENVHYDDRLVAMSTIDREKLPDLMPVNAVLGPLTRSAAEELGLTVETRVVMGAPDLHAAAVGSGAVRDYEGHLYVGTSSWITCHVPFKKVDVARNMASLPSAIPGRYFVANEQETSGGCLNFLRDNILFAQDELETQAPRDVFRRFDRLAEQAPAGSGNLIFLPWLYGERTPVENSHLRGGFFNLSLDTTRAHLVRSVFEGVGYNLRWLCEAVEHFTRRRFEALNMIGGGARSAVWCRILADILDRPIRQVRDPILANARGAALLAAMALGRLEVSEVPNRVAIERTFEPDPANRETYDRLYKEFRRFYRANRRAFARLNRAR